MAPCLAQSNGDRPVKNRKSIRDRLLQLKMSTKILCPCAACLGPYPIYCNSDVFSSPLPPAEGNLKILPGLIWTNVCSNSQTFVFEFAPHVKHACFVQHELGN